MAEDVVERVRAGYEALNQALADGTGLREIIRGSYDPEVVLEMGALEGTIRGLAGVERFLEGQAAIIEGLRA